MTKADALKKLFMKHFGGVDPPAASPPKERRRYTREGPLGIRVPVDLPKRETELERAVRYLNAENPDALSKLIDELTEEAKMIIRAGRHDLPHMVMPEGGMHPGRVWGLGESGTRDYILSRLEEAAGPSTRKRLLGILKKIEKEAFEQVFRPEYPD